jgi:transposase
MAGKLGLEARMTIKELASRQVTNCQIARMLEVDEGAVRYHLRRQGEGAEDGRSRQSQLAAGWATPIATWMRSIEENADGARNLALLHDYLCEEHDYPGSVRSLQRYVKKHFPMPRRRARRRVETPPGAQSQADWAEFPQVKIAGEERPMHAFHMALSHSRFDAVVWAESENELSWLNVHNGALRRLGGVPAVVRIDNAKTAIVRGAGAWGEIHPAYERYAHAVRFHIDACPPRSPEFKGKVERRVRDQRASADPSGREWDSVEHLQEWSDRRSLERARRCVCPATGTSVLEAWEAEKQHLGELPLLPEPFDIAVTRPVGHDCLVNFERHQYSVPFRFVGKTVEIRGCASTVQILAECRIVAEHPRHTPHLLVIDAAHFEGEATAEVLPPTPLGRMGRRLAEIAALTPERRPVDLYAALAEVAR